MKVINGLSLIAALLLSSLTAHVAAAQTGEPDPFHLSGDPVLVFGLEPTATREEILVRHSLLTSRYQKESDVNPDVFTILDESRDLMLKPEFRKYRAFLTKDVAISGFGLSYLDELFPKLSDRTRKEYFLRAFAEYAERIGEGFIVHVNLPPVPAPGEYIPGETSIRNMPLYKESNVLPLMEAIEEISRARKVPLKAIYRVLYRRLQVGFNPAMQIGYETLLDKTIALNPSIENKKKFEKQVRSRGFWHFEWNLFKLSYDDTIRELRAQIPDKGVESYDLSELGAPPKRCNTFLTWFKRLGK